MEHGKWSSLGILVQILTNISEMKATSCLLYFSFWQNCLPWMCPMLVEAINFSGLHNIPCQLLPLLYYLLCDKWSLSANFKVADCWINRICQLLVLCKALQTSTITGCSCTVIWVDRKLRWVLRLAEEKPTCTLLRVSGQKPLPTSRQWKPQVDKEWNVKVLYHDLGTKNSPQVLQIHWRWKK